MQEYRKVFEALYNTVYQHESYGCWQIRGIIEAYRNFGIHNIEDWYEFFDRCEKDCTNLPGDKAAKTLCQLAKSSIQNKVPEVFNF